MPPSIKYLVNQTQGEVHEVPCVKCTGKTAHKVLASAELRGDDGGTQRSFSWWVDYQVIQCQGCRTISFREARSDSEACYPTSNEGDYEQDIDERLFPSRVEGLKGLGDDTRYLPTEVERIYDETLAALSSQAPVLTGMGLRALLETVCKEKQAEGSNLSKKIESLLDMGVLTPASAAILHKVRNLGNAAAHEVKLHSDRQLALAMGVVEHLLKEVYILPRYAESEFEDDDA